MNSKNREKETSKVSLVSEKEYNARYNLSGNPLLKGDVEGRLYSNERINGTTKIVLAALAANKALLSKKSATVEEYAEGIKKLLSDNFGNDDWKRLEELYNGGSNRSTSPAKKINPVLRALRREGENGLIRGFAIDRIGDEAIRKAFGFTF